MAKRLVLVNGIPRMVEELEIYNEIIIVDFIITTGSPVTLPNSKTYLGDELEVRLNDLLLQLGIDYNVEGSSPYSQVSFTFDLIPPDQINFRIDREL